MPIEDAGPGTRLRHRVVLPRGDLDARGRKMEWCRENLRSGRGPRWVPPFIRTKRAGQLYIHEIQPAAEDEVWCFEAREDAVMFDMVWAP